jgi:hypothetical protein
LGVQPAYINYIHPPHHNYATPRAQYVILLKVTRGALPNAWRTIAAIHQEIDREKYNLGREFFEAAIAGK